jgi:DUF971 family protein
MTDEQRGPLRPLALRKEGTERLIVEWSDGHRGEYTWRHLRQHCPCASCKEEDAKPPNPLRVLTPSELQPKPPLAPVAMEPVGRYAYKITWNDGHDTGIFTLENLRELCQCAACQASANDSPR